MLLLNKQILHKVYCGLAVLAMLAQAVIPAGFMPDVAAAKEGIFRLVICTGYGPITSTNPHNQDHQQAPAETATDPCSFSIDNHTAIAAIPDAAQTGVVIWQQVVFATPQTHPAIEVLRKTAPPRAPPVYS